MSTLYTMLNPMETLTAKITQGIEIYKSAFSEIDLGPDRWIIHEGW